MTAPDRLSPHAREVFDRLAATCSSTNLTMPEQLLTDLLVQYSEAASVRELAAQQIAADASIFATSTNGIRYLHPAFKAIEQAERTMDRVLRRLGHGSGKAEPAPFALNLDHD